VYQPSTTNLSSILLIGQEGWGGPVNFWYKGELGFFDNYIIPVSKAQVVGSSVFPAMNV
jgi:hypothetical protein